MQYYAADSSAMAVMLCDYGYFDESNFMFVHQVRLATPNVKVGSVLDVEFFFRGLPPYWSFQESIPVRHSELIIRDNPYISFLKNYYGFIPLDVVAPPNHWIAENVPAFKPEPYLTNPKNYHSRMYIEVTTVNISGLFYKDVANSL